MVLVAPGQSTRRHGSSNRPGAAPRPEPAAPRHELLALLRQGSGNRPRFDPGLAGGLRAWLEDAACAVVAARGDDAPPLFLGPRLLSTETAFPLPNGAAASISLELATSYLVHALFRQLVTTGSVSDPLPDALAALRVDPARAGLVEHIGGLDNEARSELEAALRTQVRHLVDLTPRFAPSWLPRTDDRVAVPLAGGRVVLSGVFDLLVGVPDPGTASVCALGLSTGGRWAQARTALHYLAVLETLRSGTPPFRLALLHSAVGRYGVEDVCEEHLRAIVSHLAIQLFDLADAGA